MTPYAVICGAAPAVGVAEALRRASTEVLLEAALLWDTYAIQAQRHREVSPLQLTLPAVGLRGALAVAEPLPSLHAAAEGCMVGAAFLAGYSALNHCVGQLAPPRPGTGVPAAQRAAACMLGAAFGLGFLVLLHADRLLRA